MGNINFKEVLDSLLVYANSELHSRVLLHFTYIVLVAIKLHGLTYLTLSWFSIFVFQTVVFLWFDWKLKRIFKESK